MRRWTKRYLLAGMAALLALGLWAAGTPARAQAPVTPDPDRTPPLSSVPGAGSVPNAGGDVCCLSV